MDEPTVSAPPTRPARLSAVWLIPLAALLIGAWLTYSYLSSRGPAITLIMANAEGIQAGKTAVRTRNVQVGTVQSVTLSEDFSHTRVSVQMARDGDRMLAENSRFWVVKPRIGREGISGLGTVLSGAYIELLPGDSATRARRFEVDDSPPASHQSGPGLQLTLTSGPGSNINNGDPVNYHNLTVGRVVDSQFEVDSQQFRHQIFIPEPFDSLVSNASRFWVVSGLDVQLDAGGLQVQVPSFETLLGGGIAFASLDQSVDQQQPASAGSEFQLYENENSARRDLFDHYLEYVLLLDESVRGLQPGAPVEYQGIRIGTVEQVAWQFLHDGPKNLARTPIPVLIRIEPQRVVQQSELSISQWQAELQRLFDDGLRAALKPGNLLTGALYVDIHFDDRAAPYQGPSEHHQRPVFPTVTSGLAQIESQLRDLLDNLNQLPIAEIMDKLDRNLAVSEGTLNNIGQVADELARLVADPAIRELPGQVSNTLDSLQSALENLHVEHLESSLNSLDRTLRDAQPLLRTLQDKPNALLFPPGQQPDPQPRAPRHD